MINRITMETVAYLRSKCHLKQNLIPSWPWSFQLHFRFPVQNKIHKQKFLSDIRTAILGSIAGPCDFMPAWSDEFQKVWVYSLFSSPESEAQLTLSELLHCSVTCDLFSIFEYKSRYTLNIKTEVHTSVFCYFG